MNGISNQSTFLRSDSELANYMIYPRFLTKLALSETAKLIYVLLLDRSRLSISNGGWTDEKGRIFVIYTLRRLADDSGKSIRTVSDALKDLEDANLIFRGKQEFGKSRKICVKWVEEDCLPKWKKTSNFIGEKLPPNKNNIIKIISEYSYEEGESL